MVQTVEGDASIVVMNEAHLHCSSWCRYRITTDFLIIIPPGLGICSGVDWENLRNVLVSTDGRETLLNFRCDLADTMTDDAALDRNNIV